MHEQSLSLLSFGRESWFDIPGVHYTTAGVFGGRVWLFYHVPRGTAGAGMVWEYDVLYPVAGYISHVGETQERLARWKLCFVVNVNAQMVECE